MFDYGILNISLPFGSRHCKLQAASFWRLLASKAFAVIFSMWFPSWQTSIMWHFCRLYDSIPYCTHLFNKVSLTDWTLNSKEYFFKNTHRWERHSVVKRWTSMYIVKKLLFLRYCTCYKKTKKEKTNYSK